MDDGEPIPHRVYRYGITLCILTKVTQDVPLEFGRNGAETGKATNKLETRVRNASERNTRAEAFQLLLPGVTIEFSL